MAYDKLLLILKDVGLSQRKVADILGISEQSVSQRFHGKVRFKTHEIMKLSSWLWHHHKVQVSKVVQAAKD